MSDRAGRHAAAVLLYAKIVGLPPDYVEVYLGDFVELYAEEMERIPNACRRPPDFRVGCEVMRHAAFAVEEPQLQRHFACLLATASDARKSHAAHPAFASILTGLTSLETGVLIAMCASFSRLTASCDELERLRALLRVDSVPALDAALSNLRRLGLVERIGADAEGALAVSSFGRTFVSACLAAVSERQALEA